MPTENLLRGEDVLPTADLLREGVLRAGVLRTGVLRAGVLRAGVLRAVLRALLQAPLWPAGKVEGSAVPS